MSLGLILVIILAIALLGGFSGRFGGYGYGYGHRGSNAFVTGGTWLGRSLIHGLFDISRRQYSVAFL